MFILATSLEKGVIYPAESLVYLAWEWAVLMLVVYHISSKTIWVRKMPSKESTQNVTFENIKLSEGSLYDYWKHEKGNWSPSRKNGEVCEWHWSCPLSADLSLFTNFPTILPIQPSLCIVQWGQYTYYVHYKRFCYFVFTIQIIRGVRGMWEGIWMVSGSP